MEITKYGKSISLIFFVGYQFLRWPTSADPKKSEKRSASTPILFHLFNTEIYVSSRTDALAIHIYMH